MGGKSIAIYVTREGKKIVETIKEKSPITLDMIKLESGKLFQVFEQAFKNYSSIIAIMATGIVVRAIAPFIKDKTKDPAVVVIDERGRFVISLLSGHLGGANELANYLAEKIGATPVITTATDVNNLPSIDVFAKKHRLIISDRDAFKKIAAAILNGKKIALYQESGESYDFFSQEPFKIFENIEEFRSSRLPKIYVGVRKIGDNVLHLIPKKLVLGMGFHRGLKEKELLDFVKSVFKKESLWIESISKLATLDKRTEEEGFRNLAKILKAEPLYFSEKEISSLSWLNSSPVVLKYHNVGNVSESCAFLASRGGEILLPKVKGGKITLCIAKERSL